MKDLESRIKIWWKQNHKKYHVKEQYGTPWHLLGQTIHAVAKTTAVISLFQRSVKPAKTYLSPDLRKKLADKYKAYIGMLQQDQSGWIMSHDCDGLLFNGLMGSFLQNVDVRAARTEDGYWHRRNSSQLDCYDHGGSASSISRDMFTGLMWYLWHRKDLTAAEELYQFAKKHSFVMGFGDPARLILMPGLEAVLASIIYKLGGKNRWFARNQTQVWSKTITHYPLHLQMLIAGIMSDVNGCLPKKAVEAIKVHAAKNPSNPLHQYLKALYTNGELNQVAHILLDEGFWPSNRLPTRGDRKNSWLPSRDSYSDEYRPATDGDPTVEHTGGDLLFMAWLVLRHA